MSIMSLARLRIGVVALGLAAATAAPVLSSPANAQSVRCRLDVFSLRALDLQESNGDEIFLRLNGLAHPSTGEVTYTEIGQVERAAQFSPPTPAVFYSDTATVKVIEDDALFFNDKIGGTLVETCGTEPGPRPHIFQDRTASYELDYTVTIVLDGR